MLGYESRQCWDTRVASVGIRESPVLGYESRECLFIAIKQKRQRSSTETINFSNVSDVKVVRKNSLITRNHNFNSESLMADGYQLWYVAC